MNIETYYTTQISDNSCQFYSNGKQGSFKMLIDITPLSVEYGLYNLGFGILDEMGGINDTVEIRNGDSDIILATVGREALNFLKRNPDVNIMAAGSASASGLRVRTRKYQMGICAYYDFLIEEHNIFGFKAEKDEDGLLIGDWPFWPGRWFEFERGTNYDAFSLNLR